jgi:hypothetical protein
MNTLRSKMSNNFNGSIQFAALELGKIGKLGISYSMLITDEATPLASNVEDMMNAIRRLEQISKQKSLRDLTHKEIADTDSVGRINLGSATLEVCSLLTSILSTLFAILTHNSTEFYPLVYTGEGFPPDIVSFNALADDLHSCIEVVTLELSLQSARLRQRAVLWPESTPVRPEVGQQPGSYVAPAAPTFPAILSPEDENFASTMFTARNIAVADDDRDMVASIDASILEYIEGLNKRGRTPSTQSNDDDDCVE